MDFVSKLLFACSTSAEPAARGLLALSVESVGSSVSLVILAALIFVRRLRQPGYFLAYGICVALLALLMPTVERAREAARMSSCSCNLKQIGLAIQTYADVYKCFPPAYIVDKKGNRMHSWRVLILPFMEQKALYDEYDFNEPWNGPHNRLLVKYMPPVYRCPSDDVSKSGETSYAAIDGPGTGWAETLGSTFGAMTDGISNTIAVVEAAGAGINWMEPRDVPFSSLSAGIMAGKKPALASRHPGVCSVSFFDGHTSALQSTVPVSTLQALATRAGGEPIKDGY